MKYGLDDIVYNSILCYKFNHETLNGFSNEVRSLRYNLRIVRTARKVINTQLAGEIIQNFSPTTM